MTVNAIARWVLKLGFVAAITALAYVGIAVSVMALVACILVALNDKASGIVELSFGPLKTKLERDLSEAEKLVAKLRQLLQLQAKASISAGVRAGRFSGSDAWLYDNVRALENAMEEVGVSQEHIGEARRDFVYFTIIDAGHAAMGSNEVPSFLGNDGVAEWSEVRTQPSPFDPDRIEQFLVKWGLVSPERTVLIADMKWMQANNDIQDREQYLRSQQYLPFKRP